MTNLFGIVLFCLLWLIIPIGIGTLFFPHDKCFAPQVYLIGELAAFAIYEAFGLIFSMIIVTPLSALSIVWGLTVGVVSVYGWKRYISHKKDMKSVNHIHITKKEIFLLLVALAVIGFQTMRSITGQVLNFDDTTYAAQASTAVYTNTINCFEPTTGTAVNPRQGYYYYALWPILWATMSQITGIHTAVIMRTILPIFMIPCAYMAAYVVFRCLFLGNKEKSLIGIILLAVSYELVACNDGQIQWWLLLLSWYGKSIAPNMVCPFVLYLYLELAKETKNSNQKRLWIALFATCCGSCLIGVSCFSMIPFLIGILAITHLVMHKNIVHFIKLVVCSTPNVILFMITTLFVHQTL